MYDNLEYSVIFAELIIHSACFFIIVVQTKLTEKKVLLSCSVACLYFSHANNKHDWCNVNNRMELFSSYLSILIRP